MSKFNRQCFVFFGFILFLSNFLFALSSDNISFPHSILKQGETKSVVAFQAGNGRFNGIRIFNNSTTIPFSDTGIDYVAIVRDNDGDREFDPVIDTILSSYTFTGPEAAQRELYFSEEDVSVLTKNYLIVYTASTLATANSQANVLFSALRDSSTLTWIDTTGTNSNMITIQSSGFSYVTDGFKNLLQTSNSFAAPGMTNIPFFQFKLEATVDTLNVKSIILSNSDNNFGTLADRDAKINHIMLLVDSANNSFEGIANEVILVDTDVPTAGSTESTIELVIPPDKWVTLNKFIDSPPSGDRSFYVLYSFGNGFPPETSASCALDGARARVIASGGDILLTGALPAGEVKNTVKRANIKMNSAAVDPQGNNANVIAGQKKVRMVNLNLDINSPITGANFKIINEKGSFLTFADYGISKVSLYKQNGTNFQLVAAARPNSDSTTCDLTNIALPTGYNQDYFIEYDVGVQASTGVTRSAACKFGGVSGGNAVVGGYLPAPAGGANINIKPYDIWVQFVSVNRQAVATGSIFYVDLGVINISSLSNPPGEKVWFDAKYTRPKFYANNLNGNDVSTEYDAQILDPTFYDPSGPGFDPDPSKIITLSFTVAANNLKTNGPVIIDAQISYMNNVLIVTSQNALSQKFINPNGVTVPAARDYNSDLGGIIVDKTAFINASCNTPPKRIFPQYIASINVQAHSYSAVQRFVNGDIIPANSIMYIALADNGANIDLDSIRILHNGLALTRISDYTISDTGLITISSVGSASGGYTISGFSNNNPLDTAQIDYSISNGTLSIDKFYANPNPWDPDQGDCRIGFQSTEECTCTIYIYDASGDEIHKESDFKVSAGYNIFTWNGENKNKKKIGRGVYLVRIIAQGGGTKLEVRTKLGVK